MNKKEALGRVTVIGLLGRSSVEGKFALSFLHQLFLSNSLFSRLQDMTDDGGPEMAHKNRIIFQL